jgi:hypothetical protein
MSKRREKWDANKKESEGNYRSRLLVPTRSVRVRSSVSSLFLRFDFPLRSLEGVEQVVELRPDRHARRDARSSRTLEVEKGEGGRAAIFLLGGSSREGIRSTDGDGASEVALVCGGGGAFRGNVKKRLEVGLLRGGEGSVEWGGGGLLRQRNGWERGLGRRRWEVEVACIVTWEWKRSTVDRGAA